MKSEPITILLAEDDDGHSILVQRNLERSGVVNRFVRARDGLEAWEFLQQGEANGISLRSGPVLLLLDLKMPRMDGLELLERLKSVPGFAAIPVIVLTTTDNPQEINKCYELGCSVYISKPIQYQDFIEAVHRLGLFLQIVKVPTSI